MSAKVGAKKPVAKAAKKGSVPAKSARRPAPKPAPKKATKVAVKKSSAKIPARKLPKTSAKAPAKAKAPARGKAPAKAPIKTAAKHAATAKPAAPVRVVQPPPAPPPRRSAAGRGALKFGAPPAQAPLPPPTSRFADRFAPPRPPTRQMTNLGLDTPKPVSKPDPRLANAWKTKAGRDLTEAEVLAMPDSEYMNDKQLEFFRVKLQTLKDDLLSNAGETTEHLREDTSIVPDPADRATIEEEHALELRTRDRERKLLKKISQSLARIESGDYGFCDETGEPIGLGRLIARPTATLSLEAQQRRELKQKMFGD
jgi:DnaK suppressor protein